YNNDTTGTPIALGVLGEGFRASGAGGITLGSQFDANNAGSTVQGGANLSGPPSGSTYAGLFTSGATTSATGPITAGWAVALGRAGGPVAERGGVFYAGSLDTSLGGGLGGVALEFYRAMSLRWVNATPTTDGEIWADA